MSQKVLALLCEQWEAARGFQTGVSIYKTLRMLLEITHFKITVNHIYTTTYKIDNQQGPTVKQRELTQYSVITCMEKKSEKEGIYI